MERDHLKDLSVDGRMILQCVCKKGVEWRGVDRSGLGQGLVTGRCEYGNESSGYIKCGEFLD